MEPANKNIPTVDIDPLDLLIGQKLRGRRLMLGVTQEDLAATIGVTFQQIQKYERGTSRISASRLQAVAQALKVPVTFFYNPEDDILAFGPIVGLSEGGQDMLEGRANEDELDARAKETGALIRAYYRIEDPGKRKKVLALIRAMSDDGEE